MSLTWVQTLQLELVPSQKSSFFARVLVDVFLSLYINNKHLWTLEPQNQNLVLIQTWLNWTWSELQFHLVPGSYLKQETRLFRGDSWRTDRDKDKAPTPLSSLSLLWMLSGDFVCSWIIGTVVKTDYSTVDEYSVHTSTWVLAVHHPYHTVNLLFQCNSIAVKSRMTLSFYLYKRPLRSWSSLRWPRRGALIRLLHFYFLSVRPLSNFFSLCNQRCFSLEVQFSWQPLCESDSKVCRVMSGSNRISTLLSGVSISWWRSSLFLDAAQVKGVEPRSEPITARARGGCCN